MENILWKLRRISNFVQKGPMLHILQKLEKFARLFPISNFREATLFASFSRLSHSNGIEVTCWWSDESLVQKNCTLESSSCLKCLKSLVITSLVQRGKVQAYSQMNFLVLRGGVDGNRKSRLFPQTRVVERRQRIWRYTTFPLSGMHRQTVTFFDSLLLN